MNDMIDYAKFETLSPFEIKDALIKLARAEADKSSAMFLNAGRGNPNWIATRAREAFFLLGQFALTESKRVFEDDPNGLAGMPARDGWGAAGNLRQGSTFTHQFCYDRRFCPLMHRN